jgi:hypothetical protein
MQQKGLSRNTTRGFRQKCNKRVSPEMQHKRVSSEMKQKGLFRNATKETERDLTRTG